MKCDICNRRGMDCLPVYVWGETFVLCEDCYARESERGNI